MSSNFSEKVTLSKERPSDVADELTGLFADNWNETGAGFDLDIDRALPMLDRLYDAGLLLTCLAKYGNKPVGYYMLSVVPHHFNPRVVWAQVLALYVAPEQRRSTVTGRLIRHAESSARQAGASSILWQVRPNTAGAALFDRPRYTPAGISYHKELTNGY